MLSKKDQAIKEGVNKPKTIETFWSNTQKDIDGCQIWLGQLDHKGYGSFNLYSAVVGKSLPVKAHRFAYAITYGFDALPRGVTSKPDYVINHMCYQTACVNPLHLEVVTFEQNGSVEKRKPKNG